MLCKRVSSPTSSLGTSAVAAGPTGRHRRARDSKHLRF